MCSHIVITLWSHLFDLIVFVKNLLDIWLNFLILELNDKAVNPGNIFWLAWYLKLSNHTWHIFSMMNEILAIYCDTVYVSLRFSLKLPILMHSKHGVRCWPCCERPFIIQHIYIILCILVVMVIFIANITMKSSIEGQTRANFCYINYDSSSNSSVSLKEFSYDIHIYSRSGVLFGLLFSTLRVTHQNHSYIPVDDFNQIWSVVVCTYVVLASMVCDVLRWIWSSMVRNCNASFMLPLTMHLLSIERANRPKLHDMFNARDARVWQRAFPVGFPVRVSASN